MVTTCAQPRKYWHAHSARATGRENCVRTPCQLTSPGGGRRRPGSDQQDRHERVRPQSGGWVSYVLIHSKDGYPVQRVRVNVDQLTAGDRCQLIDQILPAAQGFRGSRGTYPVDGQGLEEEAAPPGGYPSPRHPRPQGRSERPSVGRWESSIKIGGRARANGSGIRQRTSPPVRG